MRDKTRSLCILGRQPALGLAELESLYGAEALQTISDIAVLIDKEPQSINFARLGGTVKFCKLLTILDTVNWTELVDFLRTSIPRHLDGLPPGKLRLGLSVYGFDVSPRQISQSMLEIKKSIRLSGRSVRIIPNKEPALNSAQVLHNQLTGQLGWELLFIRDHQRTVVAQSIAVQDITAYAARDQVRPKRDARVGMLPPKLAQIIINLAVGPREQRATSNEQRREDTGATDCSLLTAPYSLTLLDPFCGTGVVLQESLLMGYKAYGTDLEPRMVGYSQVNLDWLSKSYRIPSTTYFAEAADATSHEWQQFDTIATETYLGRPFSALPSPQVLQTVTQDVDTIHKKFLTNLARQTKTGFRMCLAVPAWKVPSGFKHLNILDHLEELGYTRMSFRRADTSQLVYHRPEQIVGRELVVLIRK